MLTKLKIALALSASLLGGTAAICAAQGGAGPDGPDKAALIKKYDVNGDGKLDAAEKAAMRADFKAKMLAKYDTNKDGKLDASEKAVMRDERQTAQFEKMDTNKDGQISLTEFKAAHARMGKFGHRHHRGGKWGKRGQGGAGPAPAL